MNTEKSLYPIIFNQNNLVNNGLNNKYSYKFPAGSVKLKDASLAVGSVQLYYSWFSITAAYGNNKFTLSVPNDATATSISVTIPDGNYSISDLNNLIQYQLIANNLYFTDSNGNNVYHIELIQNPTVYAVQLNTYLVPTTLPATYSMGTGGTGTWTLPTVTRCPQMTIADNFTDIIGFVAGTYPVSDAAASSTDSTIVPTVSPVSNIIIGSSITDNKFSVPTSAIYAFTPAGVEFGDLINSKPNEFSFNKVNDGMYTSIDITFYDGTFNPLLIRDTQILVQMLIKM